MSSDLLAEFDSFYRTPQVGAPNNTSAPSTSRPTSAFEDLSFLRTSNPTQGNPSHSQLQWNIPASKQSDDIWGNFQVMGAGNTQHTIATSTSDSWGNFQPPETSGIARPQEPRSKKTGYEGNPQGSYKAESRHSNPSIVRRPTIDIFSGSVADLAESSPARQQNRASPSYPSNGMTSKYASTNVPPNDSSNVLFDAADELGGNGDDDDFGDFETVSSPTPQIDLLQIESPVKAEKSIKRPSELLTTHESLKANPFPYPQAPKSPSFKERNPFADLAVTTPPISSTKKEDPPRTESPITAWPVYEEEIPAADPYHDSPAANGSEEDWGDFENLPAETKDIKLSKSGFEVDAWAWDAVDSQPAPVSAPPAEAPPPTNIPPPSMLLAIFPQLFNIPQSSLFQAVASQPFALKNRILSDPSTIDFLRAYVLLATVAARIIAGRKLRWKRDTHLSQAMKIGPAGAHGKSGMKLTGINKAEAAREEREAADLVRIWREQVGRLRSAIAAANSSLHDQSAYLAVPEITEIMTVKTEGALPAPKACVLCGLKREERIPKVDFKVEDSFGEWWVEHWGHRACRNFWLEYESKLKQ